MSSNIRPIAFTKKEKLVQRKMRESHSLHERELAESLNRLGVKWGLRAVPHAEGVLWQMSNRVRA